MQLSKLKLGTSFLTILAACQAVQAETWTKTAAGTYDWNDVNNWGGVSYPNAIDAVGTVTGDFAGAQLISLNVPITVGAMTISDSGSASDIAATIAAGTAGTLTLQKTTGSATITNSSIGVTNEISAPITFASNTTINTGTVASGAASGLMLSGGISGSKNLTVTGNTAGTGTSTLTVKGANTSFTGNWTLNSNRNGSALVIEQDTNLGAVPASKITNISVTASHDIQFNAGFTINANRGISISSGASLGLRASSFFTGTVAGDITGAGGVSILSNANNKYILLSGTNDYTGATNIGTGTLRAGSTSAFGSNSAITTGTFSNCGGLDLNGFNNSVGSLAGGSGGNGPVILGSRTLTTGGRNANTSFAGNVSGASGSLIKVGTGVQTFTGTNSYTGTTLISGGGLQINGTHSGGGAYTVNGTLSGTGSITAPVTLNDGGTLAPGASIESLATGANTWNSGGIFALELSTDGTGAAGTEWDLLSITGGLNLSAVSTADPVVLKLITMASASTTGTIASWNASVGHTWTAFVSTSAGITAFDTQKFTVDTSEFQNAFTGSFSIEQSGNNLNLVYAVPEPASLSLLGLAGLMLGRRRRR